MNSSKFFFLFVWIMVCAQMSQARFKGKGISLHIGVDYVNPKHYAGNGMSLKGAEFDALKMDELAKQLGFTKRTCLRTKLVDPLLKPTMDNVRRLILEASNLLESGDTFMLTYSGHGGLLPDLNKDGETGNSDQSWCLTDMQFVDDELNRLLAKFNPGVCILVISDSCYSGSVIKLNSWQRSKKLSPTVLCATYKLNQSRYDSILNRPNVAEKDIGAGILLISACDDDEVALDGENNSVFTEQLLKVWNKGRYSGSYSDLVRDVAQKVPASQIPQLKTLGNSSIINSKSTVIKTKEI